MFIDMTVTFQSTYHQWWQEHLLQCPTKKKCEIQWHRQNWDKFMRLLTRGTIKSVTWDECHLCGMGTHVKTHSLYHYIKNLSRMDTSCNHVLCKDIIVKLFLHKKLSISCTIILLLPEQCSDFLECYKQTKKFLMKH